MKRKVEERINKIYATFLLILITLSIIPATNISRADNIILDTDNSTQLNLIILGELPPQPPQPDYNRPEPIINWYDLQTIEGISKLNSKIDVNCKYKFCINITSDQGWDDIDYINISAWFDNGSEKTLYNSSPGGNLNLFLQYENTTGNASYKMFWPTNEVKIGESTEKIEIDINSKTTDYECRNLTFSFTPGYQFRYAPGDGSFDQTKNELNDIWSWNFKINVMDSGEGSITKKSTSIFDEFGVNSYSEIVSVGFPSINGFPGENATDNSDLTVRSRSNLNYSLSVDVSTLTHDIYPNIYMKKDTMSFKGGDLVEFTNFNQINPIYFIGNITTYMKADDYNTIKTTDNIRYKCDIPYGQLPGEYFTTVTYKMFTQN